MSDESGGEPRAKLDGHSLVVGISSYQRIAVLPSVHDAQDVTDVLTDSTLCVYPANQVVTLVDDQGTRAAILDALDGLVARTRPGSSVFIYFSGHGGRLSDDQLSDCYLMPVESTWRSPEDIARTAISGRDVSARLAKIPAARITIVLDCCRAAGIAQPGATPNLPLALESGISSQAAAPLARGRGRAVLAASRADGVAFATADMRNSLFTSYLLEGLRGDAPGTGGVIRVCDLFDYVQQKMVTAVPDQRPVFKAELEENFPVALHRGGVAPALALPKVDDQCAYDAFISYRRVSPDREWVEKALVPRLEGLGLRLCLAHRDFRLGSPRIREIERAVEISRYTVGVITPRYLDGSFEDFQSLIAQHRGLEQRAPRFIPIMRETCRPSLGIRTTEWLDVTEPELEHATLLRLGLRLREPYRLPPGGDSSSAV